MPQRNRNSQRNLRNELNALRRMNEDEFDNPRMPLLLYSSSHMTRRRNFHSALNTTWEEKYYSNPYFRFPEINAIPGRRLDERFVSEFANKTEELDQQTAILICLGDNNLSAFDTSKLRKGSKEVLRCAQMMLDVHSSSDHLLLFLGLLPRWSHTPKQFTWHQKTDQNLRELVCENFEAPAGDRLGFESTSGWFMENNFLIRDWYERDGTHFNFGGTYRLAYNCLAASSRLVSNYHLAEYV